MDVKSSSNQTSALRGTGSRIRTYEGECRQIYSLLCLTASLSQPINP